jgi:hypothetical protein
MKTDLPLEPRVPFLKALGGAAPALLGVAAVLVYALSFFLPAFDEAAGFSAFFLSLVLVVGFPMWLANPLFWSGLAGLCRGEYRSAWKAGLTGFILALSECWLFAKGLRVGYFAWAGSMALLAVAGWCGQRRQPSFEAERTGEGALIAARLTAVRARR